MHRIHIRLVVAALAVLLGACGSRRGPQVGPMAGSGQPAAVQVINNNWADMTVYVESSGTRKRLGTVTSMARRRFRVPASQLGATGEVRLVADPIGARNALVTFPVQMWPGQTVEFTIENQLATSSVVVR